MIGNSKRKKLTPVERKAISEALRIGLRINRDLSPSFYMRQWWRGYRDAVKTMAQLLPDFRFYAKFHRTMDRLEGKSPIRANSRNPRKTSRL